MTSPGGIGPLIGGAHVVSACEQTLQRWLPPTLADLNDAYGLQLPAPAEYRMVTTAEAVQMVTDAVVSVVSPGLVREPQRRSNGLWTASWSLVVAGYVRDTEYALTLRAASLYGVAIRTALMQHPSLGGLASALDWVAEDVLPVNAEDRSARTLAQATVEFTVTVDSVLDDRAAPSTATSSSGPLVTSTSVTVNPKE